jgi:flagellar biosynthesis chaperone FliJ
MSRHTKDRGMHAVARVREVRERDSRVGLLQALTSVRAREEQLAELQVALEQASVRDADTLDAFVVSRHLLASMAVAVREAEQRLDASRTVAVEAHHRWQADKARVRAIEHLLEERALRRAEEAARAEVRESDDIVGRLHARTHGVAS